MLTAQRKELNNWMLGQSKVPWIVWALNEILNSTPISLETVEEFFSFSAMSFFNAYTGFYLSFRVEDYELADGGLTEWVFVIIQVYIKHVSRFKSKVVCFFSQLPVLNENLHVHISTVEYFKKLVLVVFKASINHWWYSTFSQPVWRFHNVYGTMHLIRRFTMLTLQS